MAMSSATSTTNSDNTIGTFATLRFAGDGLEPEEISRVVKESPTLADKKGQSYRPGPRSPKITGKTGVWYFSTKRKVQSNDLADHLNALERLIAPFGDEDSRTPATMMVKPRCCWVRPNTSQRRGILPGRSISSFSRRGE
jgi:hypothetical protein